MASIKDVAKRANVGVGTVSRALNHTGYVSLDTRLKIEKAAQELGYTPNELARNLFRKKTNIIGVVIPDLKHPFFSHFIKQVEMELYEKGYKTMVCNTVGISNREKDYIDMLRRNIVDGIITGAHSLDIQEYLSIDKPIVSLDRYLGDKIPLIHSDHRHGGRLAAEALLKSGCKNVAQLGGSFMVDSPSNHRHVEFSKVMKEHKVKVQTVEFGWNMFEYEYFEDVMRKFMDEHPDVDGIFTSDLAALICVSIAKEKGIKVPEDLKIIGYDGEDFTRLIYPNLTAITQNTEELAKRCVTTLLDMLDGEKKIDYHQVLEVGFQQGGTI